MGTTKSLGDLYLADGPGAPATPDKSVGRAAFADADRRLGTLEAAQSRGRIGALTWASLSSGYALRTDPEDTDPGTVPAGTLAEVPATDAGTHADPVVGGTVDNAGVYLMCETPAPGWRRIGDPIAADASNVSGLGDLATLDDVGGEQISGAAVGLSHLAPEVTDLLDAIDPEGSADIAARVTDLESGIGALGGSAGPERSETWRAWTTVLTGEPEEKPPIDRTLIQTTADGASLLVTGAGIWAPREIVRAEPGHIYLIEGYVRRWGDPPDPAGAAVDIGVLPLTSTKVSLASTPIIVRYTDLAVASGRRKGAILISGDDLGGDVVQWPAGTTYFARYVQTYDVGHTTGIEAITCTDVTSIWTAGMRLDDLGAALAAEVAAREALDVRVTQAEADVDVLESGLAQEIADRTDLIRTGGDGVGVSGADRRGYAAVWPGLASIGGLSVETGGPDGLTVSGAGRRGILRIAPGGLDIPGLSARPDGDGLSVGGVARRGALAVGPDGVRLPGIDVSGSGDGVAIHGPGRRGALLLGGGGARIAGVEMRGAGGGLSIVGPNRMAMRLAPPVSEDAEADPTPVFARHLHLVEGEDLALYPRQMLPVRDDSGDVVMTLAGDPAPWAETSADILRAGDGLGDAAVLVTRPRGASPGTVRALALPVRRAATYAAGTGPALRINIVGDSIVHNGGGALLAAHLSAWGYQPSFTGTMLASSADGYPAKLGEGRSGWAGEDYTYSDTGRATVLPPGDEATYLAMSLSDQRDRNPFLRAEVGSEPLARNGQVFDYDYYLTRFSFLDPHVIVDNLLTNTVRDLRFDALYDQVYSDEIIRLTQYRAGAPGAAIIRAIPGPPRTASRDVVWRHKYRTGIAAVQQAIADLGDSRTVLVPGWAHATAEAGYLLATGTTDPVTGIQTTTIDDDVHPYGAARGQFWRAVAMAVACAIDGKF